MSANRCDRCGNLHAYCPCDKPPAEPEPDFKIDDDAMAVIRSLVGRTITDVQAEETHTHDDDLGGLVLTLDDGRTVSLSGWGADYCGLNIDDDDPSPPAPPTPSPLEQT